MQEGEHRDLMIAAVASRRGAAALLAGESEAARAGYAKVVEQYRAS